MRLFVRISHSGNTLTLNGYDENSTISTLKEHIEAVESMPANSDMIIIHSGRECLDSSTMAQNNLVDSATVHMVLRNPDDNQALRCGVCFENYEDDGPHVPHVLPCGHSLCGPCISHLNPRACPFDRTNLPFNDFPRNFTIIGLLQSSPSSRAVCVDFTPVPIIPFPPPTQPTGVEGRIQVFVKTLTGLTLAFDVAPSDTLQSLKQKIMDRQGVPVSQQRLVFGAKQLADTRTMRDYGITDSSIIHLIMRMLGGRS
jgi:hypothetical protein